MEYQKFNKNNVDNFYRQHDEMTTLINSVPDEDLRLDLWEKLQWLKTDFDCYRGQNEDN